MESDQHRRHISFRVSRALRASCAGLFGGSQERQEHQDVNGEPLRHKPAGCLRGYGLTSKFPAAAGFGQSRDPHAMPYVMILQTASIGGSTRGSPRLRWRSGNKHNIADCCWELNANLLASSDRFHGREPAKEPRQEVSTTCRAPFEGAGVTVSADEGEHFPSPSAGTTERPAPLPLHGHLREYHPSAAIVSRLEQSVRARRGR